MRKIEPPNATAAALVDIAETTAPALPREAKIPMPEAEAPAAVPSPYAKTNGNHQPREARDALARGLMQFDVLKAERDQLERDLIAARERIHMLEIHLKEIEDTRATIESRINTCILQRDEAVGVAAELRGVIASISAITQAYQSKIPAPDQE